MTNRTLSIALALTFCLVASAAVATENGPIAPRAIHHSDVVFMYDNPALYKAYGCTVLGWASQANARRIEEAHAAGVRMYSTSIGFLTEGSRVIDFSPDFLDAACRNFEGKPFIIPWLWDHKHKGQPAWWWCSNSPLYRKYLDMRLVEVMKAKPDGLHIDDYRGTSAAAAWFSGCFCRYCMAGFREYVGKNVQKEKLTSLGITDLDQFDYREFLLARGVKPAEYQKQRLKLPLGTEFFDFHVKANTAFVAEYRRKAEAIRGAPLALCVNSGLNDAQALAIAPHLSYFCCEVDHAAASRKLPAHPSYVYKLADGLNRPVAATASGGDWAYVAEHKLPGLVRMWIALSYAQGHNFMVPHHQWCYTKEKGTHWYEGPTEEYAWLYQFVRANARLLDGYEAVAPLAVVYDNAARRRGRGDIQPICTALAARNIPFAVVVAGDDWLDYRLDPGRLAVFKAVIVTKDVCIKRDQLHLIEKTRAEGRLITWPDDAGLKRLVPDPVQIEGSDQVTAIVRAMPADAKAPLAIHLINRQYDAAKDAMQPQKKFRLRLGRGVVGGRHFVKAALHVPRSESIEAKVHADGDDTVVEIPGVDLWTIVELAK